MLRSLLGHPPPTSEGSQRRQPGDGLRIFPGPMNGPDASNERRIVAAPWVPDASLAGADGLIQPAFLWAALDCPGAWAAPASLPMLLGRMAARLDAPVRTGQRCIVIGGHIGQERRKHIMDTALFDQTGQRLGMVRATWIEMRTEPG